MKNKLPAHFFCGKMGVGMRKDNGSLQQIDLEGFGGLRLNSWSWDVLRGDLKFEFRNDPLPKKRERKKRRNTNRFFLGE